MGEAEDPWCVPCGVIMVLPYAIELVVQQDHNHERLLHVHWRVFVAHIDNAIGIGNRSIEAELHPMFRLLPLQFLSNQF